MEYNFDELIQRKGTNSYKWDSTPDAEVLPLWVADMDFRTAPEIIAAIQKRAGHGIFGYTRVPDEYYNAVTGWFGKRHGWQMEREWIIYTSGVVPALSAIIKALTVPGDRVLVQTPVYNCFFSSIRNNGCETVSSPLIYEDGTYRIDFDDFEAKAADPSVKLFLLCNPHNPAGRVWTREELVRIGEICLRHGVTVVADEIHCELTFSGNKYIPFASISGEFQENCITCISPSKAFNIAGLQIANIVTSDAAIRQRIDKAININEVCDVNPFGIEALIAAYSEGGKWLEALKAYLYDNYIYLKEYFAEHLPMLTVTRLEGTYLVWVDCRVFGKSSEELAEELLHGQKVWFNEGTMYGSEGDGFLRINIACPRSRLAEALERFREFCKLQEQSMETALGSRITKTLDFLTEHGIGYELHTHPPLPTIEIALEYWKDLDAVHCKNLFFRNHKGNRHYLVVFECHKELAIHDLEHSLHQGKLSFASQERMERCLGLLPGSVSPLGLMNDIGLEGREDVNPKELYPNGHRVKLFLDKELKDARRVSFHPCDNTASVILSSPDFLRFLEIWGGEYEWIEV